jgi:glycosyltransferase involved in cell wall biosynthesis
MSNMQNENQSSPLVSFVVPCRNEADYIGECVRSILEQDYPANRLEVLVVDGMSTDATVEVVERLAAQDDRVSLHPNPQLVVAPAMNIGIRKSKGDLIAIVGGHATVDRDFIKEAVRVFDAHPDVWCAGGPIRNRQQDIRRWRNRGGHGFPVGVGNARFRLGGDYEGYADTVPFPVFRRWSFDRTGMFDEELVRNQDDEMAARLHQKGGRIFLSSRIRATYFARSSLGKLWRQYFQYGFWRIRTIQKLGKPATLRQVVPLAFVCGLIVLAVTAILWPPVRYVFAAYVLTYVLGLMVGAVQVGRKVGLGAGLLAPVIFAILHFAYGLGSLKGVWVFSLLRRTAGRWESSLSR